MHSLKTALLLALACGKLVGDLQALSVKPTCLEFRWDDCVVRLRPRHGYVPTVLTMPFMVQVITLQAFAPEEFVTEDTKTLLLCPVHALCIYSTLNAPASFVCWSSSLFNLEATLRIC